MSQFYNFDYYLNLNVAYKGGQILRTVQLYIYALSWFREIEENVESEREKSNSIHERHS